jgi:hypothetical protein
MTLLSLLELLVIQFGGYNMKEHSLSFAAFKFPVEPCSQYEDYTASMTGRSVMRSSY